MAFLIASRWQKKTSASRALIEFLKNRMPVAVSCKLVMYQGELGKIAALRDIICQPDSPQVTSYDLS